MKKPIGYILMGVSGSGKSTWAKGKVSDSPWTIIVNKDSIRSMFFGTYDYDPNVEDLVREATLEIIALAIQSRFNVIIDETNLSRDRRDEYTKLVMEAEGVATLVTFEAQNHLENRMKDPRGLPRERWEGVIEKQLKSIEKLSHSERQQYSEVIDIVMEVTK